MQRPPMGSLPLDKSPSGKLSAFDYMIVPDHICVASAKIRAARFPTFWHAAQCDAARACHSPP
ncbi:MAG TPA: hypothetical protein VEA63_02475, partial [Opitutus sp.]|nr:hypothetical protein [Opitutus sp.]